MIINKLTPQGFCKGVYDALKIVTEASNDNSIPKPIYILGKIINNKHVTDELLKQGIITIDTPNKTRLELLDEINSGTIIFSAHGVSNLVRQKAKEKQLNIIDASCTKVLDVQNTICKYLNQNYDIIYIGTKNHPECEGVLGLSEKIHFITNLSDIESLNINNKNIYVTNQTTLSLYDIEKYYNDLLNLYPEALIDNNICNATTLRQKAVLNQPKADLCIVVGDTLSSNSKKLAYISENHANIKSILVEDKSDLLNFNFTNINTINITSGASTPKQITDDIIEYLKTIKKL